MGAEAFTEPTEPTESSSPHPADRALAEGLRQLAVPETSPDFAARIHAALARREPWWAAPWRSTRPVLVPAAGSLAGMLVLLAWLAASPARPSHPAASPTSPLVASRPRTDTGRELYAASLLGGRWLLAGADEAPAVRPAPQRHLRLPDAGRHA